MTQYVTVLHIKKYAFMFLPMPNEYVEPKN